MKQVVKNPAEFATVFADNFNSRDLEALVENYSTNALMDLGGGNLFIGRDEIRKALGNFLAYGLPISTNAKHVAISDDIAYVIMDFVIEGTGVSGDQVHVSGTASDILVREADGNWRQRIDLPFGAATA